MLFNEIMQESHVPIESKPVELPPTINKILNSPVRIDKSVGSGAYTLDPVPTDWNEVNKKDEAHKVLVKKEIKTEEGKKKQQKKKEQKKFEEKTMSLSDFFLENAGSLAQLAFKEGFITQKEINTESFSTSINIDEATGKRERKITMMNGKPAVIHPFSFLKIEVAGNKRKLVIPEHLTAQQRESLLLLVYTQTVNTPDFPERKHSGPTNILLEKIVLGYKKFNDVGQVYDGEKSPYPDYEGNPVLESLNIALRKAVDAKLKDEAYRKTKIFQPKGVSAEQSLRNRLMIAAGLSDESKSFGSENEISTLQNVHQSDAEGNITDKGELEHSVQIDMLVAQAFDILIPAEVRLKMMQDQIKIENTLDYRERAELVDNLDRQKQIWRMAIMRNFELKRNFAKNPLMPSLAAELDDKNVSSAEEKNVVEDNTRRVAHQIEILKKEGGFTNLDLTTSNIKKTKLLLESLLKQEGKGSKKINGKEIESALESLFAKSSEWATKKLNDNDYVNLFNETRLLNQFGDENKELVLRILKDSFGAQMGLERRLTLSTKGKIGTLINPTDIKLGSHIYEGLKGMELFYRRGRAEKIDEADRYKLKSESGKDNYKIVRDKQGIDHIVTLNKDESISNEQLEQARSAMTQSTDKTLRRKVSTAPAINVGETDPAKVAEVKRLNEQAVELGRILGLENVTDRESFEINLAKSPMVSKVEKVGEKPYALIKIEKLDLDSARDLEFLSHLSEIDPDAKIQIDSLTLVLGEAGNNKIENSLNNFNIGKLIVNLGENGNLEMTTAKSQIGELQVVFGNLTLNTDQYPMLVTLNNGANMIVNFATQADLEKAISTSPESFKMFADVYKNSTFSVGVTGDASSQLKTMVGEGTEQGLILVKNGAGKIELANTLDVSFQFPEAEARRVGEKYLGINLAVGDIVVAPDGTVGKYLGKNKSGLCEIKTEKGLCGWGENQMFELIESAVPVLPEAKTTLADERVENNEDAILDQLLSADSVASSASTVTPPASSLVVEESAPTQNSTRSRTELEELLPKAVKAGEPDWVAKVIKDLEVEEVNASAPVSVAPPAATPVPTPDPVTTPRPVSEPDLTPTPAAVPEDVEDGKKAEREEIKKLNKSIEELFDAPVVTPAPTPVSPSLPPSPVTEGRSNFPKDMSKGEVPVLDNEVVIPTFLRKRRVKREEPSVPDLVEEMTPPSSTTIPTPEPQVETPATVDDFGLPDWLRPSTPAQPGEAAVASAAAETTLPAPEKTFDNAANIRRLQQKLDTESSPTKQRNTARAILNAAEREGSNVTELRDRLWLFSQTGKKELAKDSAFAALLEEIKRLGVEVIEAPPEVKAEGSSAEERYRKAMEEYPLAPHDKEESEDKELEGLLDKDKKSPPKESLIVEDLETLRNGDFIMLPTAEGVIFDHKKGPYLFYKIEEGGRIKRYRIGEESNIRLIESAPPESLAVAENVIHAPEAPAPDTRGGLGKIRDWLKKNIKKTEPVIAPEADADALPTPEESDFGKNELT